MVRHVQSLSLAITLVMEVASLTAQYSGTGSVSQGRATTTQQNVYTCPKGRVTNLGEITAMDGTIWTMPAVTHFSDPTFPTSSDLHNVCTGVTHATSAQAVAALLPSNIVMIDPDGELVTCFVFADNYFEMAINGVPVGKDNVPYTQFNSSLVQFRVKRPFTVAIHAVDWEENLGLGTELSGSPYHAGDGGVVAVFRDEKGAIIATTNDSWKAQTFYTAPIYDLSCPREEGQARLSSACSTADVADGTNAYALHWPLPTNWMAKDLDDSQWPKATEFANQTVGVDNKPAYTNFIDVFDNPVADAKFIWSSSLILDNEILLRAIVPGTTSINDADRESSLRLEMIDGAVVIRAASYTGELSAELIAIDGSIIASTESDESPQIYTALVSDGVYLLCARGAGIESRWLINLHQGECSAIATGR
ncbi:MAG: hypothetical protein FGM33_09495 [Candidatus Kapabacteria bacterium]|nr:hypothetical protein [Candidatus Kapabacteria bacterium]